MQLYTNRTEALNGAIQYRNHPSIDLLTHTDDETDPIVMQHIRTCSICSRIRMDFTDGKIKQKIPNTITDVQISVGDIVLLSMKDITMKERTNSKNEFFNPPEMCIISMDEHEVLIAQCFPNNFKPLASNGDVLSNDYYIESWNMYHLPLTLFQNTSYTQYIQKAVSKKLIKNILSNKNTDYHSSNNFTNKFRENELRIAQIWKNILFKV